MEVSGRQALVEYLSSRKTQDVLRFVVSHLAVSRPEDPVAFLSDLMQKALQYRDCPREGEGSPFDDGLCLFQRRHIEAVFNAMDPFRKGVISFIQYHNGMGTLGIAEYDRHPKIDGNGNVSRDTFIQEA